MKEVTAFNTTEDAIVSLDNGGRFFDMMSKPDDGVISQAEVAKVAGVFSDKQSTVLFLDMALANLSSEERTRIVSHLSPTFKAAYEKYKPLWLFPSEAARNGVASSSVIVTGVPTLLRSVKDFVGFILVPAVKAFVLIPLIDKYDVYEIRDEVSSDIFLIAHAKGAGKLPQKMVKVAGIVKQLKARKEEEDGSKNYLEVLYFMDDN